MKRKTMLICEDQKRISRIMAEHFTELGYNVEVVNVFSEIAPRLATKKYDIVLCDSTFTENEPRQQTQTVWKRTQLLDYSNGKPLNHEALFVINEDDEDFRCRLSHLDRYKALYSPCSYSALLSAKERRTYSDAECDYLEQTRLADSKIKAVELVLNVPQRTR